MGGGGGEFPPALSRPPQELRWRVLATSRQGLVASRERGPPAALLSPGETGQEDLCWLGGGLPSMRSWAQCLRPPSLAELPLSSLGWGLCTGQPRCADPSGPRGSGGGVRGQLELQNHVRLAAGNGRTGRCQGLPVRYVFVQEDLVYWSFQN